eukprot:6485405-Amphidinium_carterae.1
MGGCICIRGVLAGRVHKFPGELGAKASAAWPATRLGQLAKGEQPRRTIRADQWPCPVLTARWSCPCQGATWQERYALPNALSTRLTGDDVWRRARQQVSVPYCRWLQRCQGSQW